MKHYKVMRGQNIRLKLVRKQNEYIPIKKQSQKNEVLNITITKPKSQIIFKKDKQILNPQSYNQNQQYNKQDNSFQSQKWEKNHFQFMKQLGKGKFGHVYLARQKKSNYIVAIKKINKLYLQKNNCDKRIIKQIQIQSFLKHQNILRLFGFFWDNTDIYLILQYAPGGQLYKQLKLNKKFPQKKVASIIKQVAQGLIYLHANKIIHRDIKPQNLLISFDKIKIADFGWSIYSDTRRQTICGTLDYLAPQMVKGQTHDHAIDVWAVGILCFELAAGFPPFQTASYEDTYNKICMEQIEYPVDFSDNLRIFLRKLLMKNCRDRIELKQALKQEWILENA